MKQKVLRSFLLIATILGQLGTAFAASTIFVDLRNSQNNGSLFVPGGETADITCIDEDYTTSFSGSITSGNYSTNIVVAPGDKYYRCDVSGISYYQTGPGWAYIPNGGTGNLTIYLTAPDATVDIEFVDSSGSPVTVTNGGNVTCSDYSGVYNISKTITANSTNVSIDLVGGECYTCQVGGNFGSVAPMEDVFVCVNPSDVVSKFLHFSTLDSQINISFVDQNGSSLALPAGGSGSVICNSSDGYYSFSTSVTDGDTLAQVDVVGGTVYSCVYSGSSAILSDYTYIYAEPSGSVGADLELTVLGSTLNVRFFTDDNSSLIVPANGYPYVYCYRIDGQYGYFQAEPSYGSSSVSISTTPGEIQCSAYGFDGYSLAQPASATVAFGATQNLDLIFYPHDSTLAVALVDGSNNPVTVNNGSTASVSCHDSDFQFWYSDTIVAGQSSTTIDLVGNRSYTCNAWLAGYATEIDSVQVPASSSTNLNLTTLATDSTLTVTLKDQNGTVLNISGSVYASPLTSSFSHYASSAFVSGTAQLSLVSGISYGLYTYFSSGSTIFGLVETSAGSYLAPTQLATVQTTAGSGNQAVVTLYKTDASIQVSVKDSNSTALGGAWIAIADTSDINRYLGAISAENGPVTIPVIGGRTYRVSAYPGSNLLAPASVEVTPQTGGSASVTLTAPVSDYVLNIAIDAPGAESGTFYCFAYTLDGLWSDSMLGAALGTSISLPMSRVLFTPSYVGCWGLGSDSEDQLKFFESELQLYIPITGSSDSISITMNERGDAIYQQYTFQGDSAVTLDLGGGNTLDVPAGAYGSGQITLTIRTSSAPNTGNEQPIVLYEVTATDENGLPLELQVGSLEFHLVVDEDNLPPGSDAQDSNGAYWDGSSYRPLPTEESLDDSSIPSPFAGSFIKKVLKAGSGAINRGNKLGLVSRFATISSPLEPEAPTGLKAKLQKSGKVKVRWNEPAGADSCTVKVYKKSKPTKSLFSRTVAAGTSVVMTKKFPANKYKVKVHCSNSIGNGPEASKNFSVE